MNWHEIRMEWVSIEWTGMKSGNMRLWALMRKINEAGVK